MKDGELVERNPYEQEFLPEIIYPSVDKFSNTNLIISYSALTINTFHMVLFCATEGEIKKLKEKYYACIIGDARKTVLLLAFSAGEVL